jgi:hypothetical protein
MEQSAKGKNLGGRRKSEIVEYSLQPGQAKTKMLNVAKVGGLQSRGVKGEAVVIYRNPLTTQDLKFSGFP